MSLPIVLTTAGFAAMVNARNTGTNAVEIVSVGITQTAFTGTAATTVLPGEIARLTTFAGDVVADDTIHLTIRDEGTAVYALRGFGLYMANGVLLGTYGQAEPILQKTAASMALLAADIKLAAGDAAAITFGATNFINPPATTEQAGVIALATAAQAVAGLDPDRAITPATLKPLLDALVKLVGGQTITGNIGFGGAPPVRPVTAQSEMVIRNPSASVNYRNWSFITYGGGGGTLLLRHLTDAANQSQQDFLTIDGTTRVVDFMVTPRVAGNGVWHGGNMPVDTAASGGSVAKRFSDGSLQATYLTVPPGAGIANGYGGGLYTPGIDGAFWHIRSSHGTNAGVSFQRKDGTGLGGLLAEGEQIGLLNKNGTWRFRADGAGGAYLHADNGSTFTVWSSSNFDPASKANAQHSHDWGQVTGKPATYPPDTHNHPWASIPDKPSTFAPSPHAHDWSDVTGRPASYPPSAHGHPWSAVSEKPSTFPPDAHTHDWSQVTGRPSTYPPSSHGHGWSELSGKPAAFPPEVHTHDLAALASSIISLAMPGYMRIGPLLLQWGTTSFLASDTTANSVSFPIAFPNTCFGALPVPTVSSGTNNGASRYGWSVTYWDQYRFEMINDSPASSYLFLAWGY